MKRRDSNVRCRRGGSIRGCRACENCPERGSAAGGSAAPLLDAACGHGRGVALGWGVYRPLYAVDASWTALRQARRLWDAASAAEDGRDGHVSSGEPSAPPLEAHAEMRRALASQRVREVQACQKIHWVQADLGAYPLPCAYFAGVCAFGFTDWDFLRRAVVSVRSGGFLAYHGFSPQTRSFRPHVQLAWTSTPAQLLQCFAGWEIAHCATMSEPPCWTQFLGFKP